MGDDGSLLQISISKFLGGFVISNWGRGEKRERRGGGKGRGEGERESGSGRYLEDNSYTYSRAEFIFLLKYTQWCGVVSYIVCLACVC